MLLADGVDHVVVGDGAKQPALVIHHGHGHEVVPVGNLDDLHPVGLGGDADEVGDGDLVETGLGGHGDQDADVNNAGQLARLVDHVDVSHALGVDLGVAEVLDGLLGGGALSDGDELAGHQPAGGIVGILEKLLDLVGLIVGHKLQHALGLLAVHAAHNVGAHIRRHGVDDLCELGVLGLLHQLLLDLVVDLLENDTRLVGLQEAEDLRPFLPLQLLHRIGDVNRVIARDQALDRAAHARSRCHANRLGDRFGVASARNFGTAWLARRRAHRNAPWVVVERRGRR